MSAIYSRYPNLSTPANLFTIGTTVTTDSGFLVSTTYAPFDNSPTVTFAPKVSGYYRLTLGPVMVRLTESNDCHIALIFTVGTPTWKSGGELAWTQEIANDIVDHFLQGIYFCQAGTLYTAQLQGFSAAGSLQFLNSDLVHGSNIVVEQIPQDGNETLSPSTYSSSFSAQTGGGEIPFPYAGIDIIANLTSITVPPGKYLLNAMFTGWQAGDAPVSLDGVFCGISLDPMQGTNSSASFSDRADAINACDQDITVGAGLVMTAIVPGLIATYATPTTVYLKASLKFLNGGTPMIDGWSLNIIPLP